MINTNSPDFERPATIYKNNTRMNVETYRFSGKPSYDGAYGGMPLMFDQEHGELVLDPSDNHTIVFGATGSKKTRAYVMPAIKALAHCGESLVIHDAKGELYARMAGELQKLGYHVINICFRDPQYGHGWNPLEIPWQYYKEGDLDKAAEFANDISNTLMLAEVSNNDPFFDYASCDTCYGLILMLMKYCKEYELPEGSVNIANLLELRRELFKHEKNIDRTTLWRWASEDELIAASLSGTVYGATETRNSILSVFDQKLRSLSIKRELLDMLANNQIDIEKIGKEKTAVFLITPDEKTTYHRLVALFISQSYQFLIYKATANGGRVERRINYVLDEFSSLPAIGSDFPSMISAARSRNVRFCIVCQSKNQLIRRYREEAETIIANCNNVVFFTSRELPLLQEISELCGRKRDGTPNVSVFDLQHLSKEKNEALVLTGRMKPCLVNMMEIDQFPDHRVIPAEYEKPERVKRQRIVGSEMFQSHGTAGSVAEATEAMLSKKEDRRQDGDVALWVTRLNEQIQRKKQEEERKKQEAQRRQSEGVEHKNDDPAADTDNE